MPRPFPEAVIAGLLSTISLSAQPAQPLTLYQSSFELHPGQSTLLRAATETIAFVNQAAKRDLTIQGAKAAGLVISPSRDGSGVVLGASLRTKPGNYTVQVTATASTGVRRSAALAVTVDSLTPVPSSATRPPVVLLNGWIGGFTNTCTVATSSSETFGNLAQYLVSDGAPVVYLFDNCLEDPNQSIETLAEDLGKFLNSITYDNGAQVPQIDLVAHSMGGLIVRAYLAGLQSGGVFSPPTPTLVHDLVMIAVPNFGSFVAGTYAVAFEAGSQSAEMAPGSSFLWNLATWNQRQDDLRGVNTIAVIGNTGTFAGGLNNSVALTNASDGIVSLTSASLDFILQGAGITRIVPYCHVDPSAFTNTNLGTYLCDAPGIANVNSTSQETGQIVRSFLAGTSTWQSIGATPATDPYLSVDGGLYFAAVNAQNQYLSDLTSVAWGTLPFLNGADTNTIYYYDFINGTGVFEAASQSQGNLNCGSLTEPVGYYSAARCKVDTDIFSVGPLVTGTNAKLVNSGAKVTLTGYALGNSQCSGCKVEATPAGSSTTTTLAISSWTNTSITAALPATFSGLVTIAVIAPQGVDAINIMAIASSSSTGQPVLSATPTSLSFTYAYGSAAPASQTVSIANTGTGTLSWIASDPDFWVALSPSSGSGSATLTVTLNPANLAPGSYSSSVTIAASGATGSPVTIAITLSVTGAPPTPAVTAAANIGDYQPSLASATWLAVFGTNLSQTTATWSSANIVNSVLPTSLDGVSVTIDSVPAYVEYISPGQINVLAPDDATLGPVDIQVTTAGQASNTISAAKQKFAPAFFTLDNGAYVTAVHANGTLVGTPGVLGAGVTTSPASSGETIQIYGTGFGPTNPVSLTADLIAAPALLANTVQFSIGGATAVVAYAGLVSPGLYQFNVTIPALPSGDAAIAAQIGGIQTQSGVALTIQ